jgi:hypothetical protein
MASRLLLVLACSMCLAERALSLVGLVTLNDCLHVSGGAGLVCPRPLARLHVPLRSTALRMMGVGGSGRNSEKSAPWHNFMY